MIPFLLLVFCLFIPSLRLLYKQSLYSLVFLVLAVVTMAAEFTHVSTHVQSGATRQLAASLWHLVEVLTDTKAKMTRV